MTKHTPPPEAAVEISGLHKAALDYAARGIPVFPCEPGTKRPLAGSRGFYEATTDPAQINAWWTQDPERNVAFSPEAAGLCVIDIDGAEGEEAWAALEMVHGEVPTHQVITPRGGRHLYYQGSLPGTQSKLAAHIDTRGRGSYVLAAPSLVDERHEPGYPAGCYQDPDPFTYNATMPPWVGEVASRVRERQLATPKVTLDSPGNLDRARRVVEARIANGNLARQGEGGNAKFFELACELGDLGVSEETCPAIMAPWVTACGPAWADPDALVVTVANAYRYRQNQAGAYASEDVATAFAGVAAAHAAPAKPAGQRVVLRDEAMQDRRHPIEWLIEGFLPDGGTVAIHAPFNSYKSFVAADAALSVASGQPAFGALSIRRQGPVVYMLGEGAAGFETQRRPAWRAARSIEADRRLPIYTIEGVPPVRSADDVADYMAAVDSLPEPPSLIVIDTMARAMAGLNENDAGDAALYLNMVEVMARQFGCCILSILHEGKEAVRGARGSSAFPAGFDNVWRIEADTAGTAAKLIPVKLKDDAGVAPICLKGREVASPGRKGSLVFDLIAGDDYRKATGGRVGITKSEIGAALLAMGVTEITDAEPVTTQVLAVQIAGEGAPRKVVDAKARNLRDGAAGRFLPYVVHPGTGRHDPSLWRFPKVYEGEAPQAISAPR